MARTGVDRAAAIVTVGLACVTGGVVGCQPTHQFSGMLRYDNLLKKPVAEAVTRLAREQLLERATANGLEPTVSKETLLVFRTQAPRYVVTLDDGTTEERVDHRIVQIEVRLDNRVGQDVYRYFCWVKGAEPPVFDDEDRARFGLALLALREIFETPIEMELLGGG